MKQEHNQTFWQLASIQSASTGLPLIVTGSRIAKEYGAGSAIISIFIGNIIIWIVALTIVSMAAEDRKNAIENVKRYLGKFSSIFAALVVMLACLIWYLLQINSATIALGTVISIHNQWEENITLRYGAILGILTSLFAIGGIRLIKWICVVFLPVLFYYFIYAMLLAKYPVSWKGTWVVSLPGIISIILFLLPGMINLPTFFKHSRSKADSYLGLTIWTVCIIFFQVCSVFIGFNNFSEIFSNHSNELFPLTLVTCFIVLSLICSNLVNIYFASASWEAIFPRFVGAKEYAIIGLGGTIAYTFIQISSPMLFLENLADSFIASLGIVLLIDFLIRVTVRRRPRTYEKLKSATSWMTGCIVTTILQIQNFGEVQSLLAGMGASTLFFLVVLFVEETLWSIKKLRSTKKY